MKIVINRCYGGFGLSDAAHRMYADMAGHRIEDITNWDIPRDDPRLVTVVEELGAALAGDHLAYLKVVDIPDDVDWYIDEYDGMEHIAEKHRTWS
jgi:hypothetical protein